MTGSGHRRVWTYTFRRDLDPDVTTLVQDNLVKTINGWCLDHGYSLTRITWSLEQDPTDVEMTRMVAECQLHASWEGRWGSIRTALEEDGLLPPGDRRSRSAPPESPAVGDLWYAVDPGDAAGMVHVFMWDGEYWREYRVIEATDEPVGKFYVPPPF